MLHCFCRCVNQRRTNRASGFLHSETPAGLSRPPTGGYMSLCRISVTANDPAADTPMHKALRVCRKQFILVGLFSGAVNLLQLTTSIYMMQIFDRVLASRILDTLLYLSLIAGAAVLVLALLEAVR